MLLRACAALCAPGRLRSVRRADWHENAGITMEEAAALCAPGGRPSWDVAVSVHLRRALCARRLRAFVH